ncbi:MAG: hypothetical protein JNL70_06980 [Saprospiraceae bacterium]|nr:hypothetical protein [Saprospiraceae bacterium]
MNERDLDNLFSKKLNEEGQYANLDSNWEKVKAKLAMAKNTDTTDAPVLPLPIPQSKDRKWLVPSLLAALMLLLASNGWLLWRLQPLLINQPQTNPSTIHLTDTIFETKVIYRIDTIYQRIVSMPTLGKIHDTESHFKSTPSVGAQKNNVDEVPSPVKAEKLPSTNPSSPNNSINKGIESIKKQEKKENIPIIHNEDNHSGITTDSTNAIHIRQESNATYDSLITTTPTDTLKWAKVPYDSLELKPTEQSQQIIKANAKKKIIDYFALGLQAGGATTVFSDLDMRPSFWIGLGGEVHFKKRWSLSTSFDNAFYHYKTTVRDPLLHVPSDPPMTENYKLKYIEGETSSLQIGLGLSYSLLNQTRFTPFVSMNYINRWILPYQAEFEFLNLATGEERSFSVEENSYHHDTWYAVGAGLSAQLTPKLEARLKSEIIYDHNHGQGSLTQFLLRGGIFFKF